MPTINPFLLALTALSINCSAQSVNASKFIEPNISIAYDSTQFIITNSYSNTAKKIEGIDFSFRGRKTQTVIHVKANHPLPEVPAVSYVDSFMLNAMQEIRQDLPKEFRIVAQDAAIRHINTFSCVGFIVYDSEHKGYYTTITGNHFSANDMTEVKYNSFDDTTLETGYKAMAAMLAGFKSFSGEDIQKEEKQIRQTYTVSVKKLDNPPKEIKLMPHTFAGIVQISPKPAHELFGVSIDQGNMQQLFRAGKDNNIYITCRDSGSGVIRKSGHLVLLNAFGKKVEIPISFEYTK